ncbi:hypothetical protein ONZ45_g18377 [Pleurotus djamor]|nr:hypothetical protein ONZ45_g18377 [Pleurotus djamor]
MISKIFLVALYDGVSSLHCDLAGFPLAATVLTLVSKYQVRHLRHDLAQTLHADWPLTLDGWDKREESVEDPSGLYFPRDTFPHPIMVINLARMAGAPELLPSAFYDLSRYSPSAAAAGYMCPTSRNTQLALLSPEDLMRLLRGREHASRYLSTFVVNHLEGRPASQNCAYSARDSTQRSCQAAFEAITFELLLKINSAGDDIRLSDPLYMIRDLEAMLNRNFVTGGEHPTIYRACENCRDDFRQLTDSIRANIWTSLPRWFGVDDETSDWST